MREPRSWPWLVAGLAIAMSIALALAEPRDEPTPEAFLLVLVFGTAIAALAVVGAILVARVPGNVIGYLLLGAGVLMGAAISFGSYASMGSAAGTTWPGVELAALLNQVLFMYPLVITLIAVPLVFPDGRLPSRRWRWLVFLTIAAMAASTIADLLDPTPLVGGIVSPLASPDAATTVETLDSFASFTSIIGFGGAAAAVVVRYRRSSGVEREQMKWLLTVAAFAAVVVPSSFLAPTEELANALFLLDLVAFIALPIAIGIAVLRYRLYDIDRLISRTIGWAIVTALLVGAFAVLVLGLTSVLEPLTGGNTLAIAGSTLVVAALFQPVRRRVQRAVDRRFDRSRYDGEHLVAAFAERLRDEVDLAAISSDMLATVDAAVRPTNAGLWLRERPEVGA